MKRLDKLVHDAPVPVLIVREDEAKAAEPIRSILFATDFSEDAERAEKGVTNDPAYYANALDAWEKGHVAGNAQEASR